MEPPPAKRYEEPAWSAIPIEDAWRVEVLKEGQIVDTLPLRGKAFFTLGRQHGLVDLPMDHPSLSRMHAVLNFRDDGALMIRDLGMPPVFYLLSYPSCLLPLVFHPLTSH
jgi:hypothetical protein